MQNKNTRRGFTQNHNVILNRGHYLWAASRKVVIRDLIKLFQALPRLFSTRGFTLIELLVVVLIIGLLTAVAVPQYKIAVEKALFAEAVTQLKALAHAEKIYFLANGKYTENFDDLDISFEGYFAVPTDLQQKNWFLSTSNIQGKKFIHAGRKKDYLDGRWYILCYLPTQTMYCRALAGDTKAQKICKALGQQTACPFDANDNTCYLLP